MVRDKHTLCPFCDSRLPLSPSPVLKTMLERMEKISQPDPRPDNLDGRKGSMVAFMSLCARHRLENKLLPRAQLRGWPTEHNWEDLGLRINAIIPHLQAIVNDLGGARKTCTFWIEATEKGGGMIGSLEYQMRSFNKSQVG